MKKNGIKYIKKDLKIMKNIRKKESKLKSKRRKFKK